MATPAAAPTGTAMMKATITSKAVTTMASCTCGRANCTCSIATTSLSGGRSMGFTIPVRGVTSHAPRTKTRMAKRTRMICQRFTMIST